MAHQPTPRTRYRGRLLAVAAILTIAAVALRQGNVDAPPARVAAPDFAAVLTDDLTWNRCIVRTGNQLRPYMDGFVQAAVESCRAELRR